MTNEEAIKVLNDYDINFERHTAEEVAEAHEMAIKALQEQQKTGHWIMTSDYLTTAYGSIDYVKCSCCGEDSLEEGDYCPNCGIKMEEKK